jgi:hypothetical protein
VWVMAAATAFFAVATLWEIGSPLQGGHWASMAGCAIAADNMVRYHLFAAVTHYVTTPPPDHNQYYCRHPYAIYLMEALSRALFGQRAWAIRVPAAVCSLATPVVLFRLARALWGPVPAAVATVGFVVVPIDLAFSCFSSLEVPTILFGLIFCLGTVRVWQGGRGRDVVVAGIGALGATNSDWIGAVLVFMVLAFGVVRLARHRSDSTFDSSLHRRWLLVVGAATLGTLLLYTLLILSAGQLHDVIYGARLRSSGASLSWHVLGNRFRLMRLGWMVPEIGFLALAAGCVVATVRLRTRPCEAVLLAWTVTGSFQYLVFKAGADVHIFWPHYFGPCVALALGALASGLLSLSPGILRAGGLVAAVLAPLVLLARVAIPILDQGRLTQGRFDEHTLHIEPGADAAVFAAWATRDLPRSSILRPTSVSGWHVEYATGLAQELGPIDLSARSVSDRDRVELVDARYATAGELREIARSFDTVAVGPFLRVDRAVPGAGVLAMRYLERQPTVLERALVTDHDLVRAIGPDSDPWATWEWADALGTAAPPEPSGEPTTFHELGGAHNVAMARGDVARADALRARAVALLGTAGADFTDDVRLLGALVEHGPATVVTLLWETGPTFEPVDTTFSVRCHVTAPPALWPAPVDPMEREVAPPMVLKPSLWRAGHLYTQRFVALPGLGIERCRGYFTGNVPHPANGAFAIDLFTL